MNDTMAFSWQLRRELRSELVRRVCSPSSIEAVDDAMECLRLTDPDYGHPSAQHDDSAPGWTENTTSAAKPHAGDSDSRLRMVPANREALERKAIRLCIYGHRDEFRKVLAILERRAKLTLVTNGDKA